MANTTDWLSISSSSGQSGQTTLTVTARKNLSGDFKTAEIRAYSPLYNVSSTTYVTMEQYGPYIYVSQNIFGIPASGGSYNLAITSNTSYVISFPEMVSTYSASAGTGNTAITFTVPALSDSSTTVVGNIVITDESGQYSTTVRLEEYGSDAYAHPSTGQLVFPVSGGSLTFTVTANCVYNISDTISEWGTVSPRSGYTGVTTFTVTMNGANTGTSANTGQIFLTGPGGTGLVNVLQQAPERRLAITYNVTSTTEPTQILSGYNGSLSAITKAEYNGNEITVATGYTFPSTGQQTVYYTLSGTVVPDWAFYECPVLTAVIPDGVTEVARLAFNSTKLLQTVSFPNTLEIIGNSAFYDCSSLTSVTIPASVTTIGSSTFSGVGRRSGTVITRDDAGPVFVRFEGLTPPTVYGNTFHYNSAYTGYNLQEIRVPCASYNAYVSAMSAYTPIITCYSDTQLYFNTDTSNVAGTGETRTVTLLNYDLVENSIGTNWQSGEYWVCGNTIYIRYSENPSSSSTRSWTINIYARTKDNKPLTGSFSITQNANYTYPIPYTADTSVVAASGETRTITIDTSNLVASSITIGVEGATGVTYTYENGVITVTLPCNPGNERNITVAISGISSDGYNAYASVTYSQNGHYTYDIPYTANTAVIADTGETRTIAIDTSNLAESSITIGVEGATGVTTSYSNGVITVIFPLNKGAERTFTVNITANTVSNIAAYASISYTQSSSALIPYSGDTSTVAASGETRVFTFDITDLVPSSITASVAGQGVTYSFSGDTLELLFLENTGYSFNDYTIEISGQTISGKNAYATIQLVQNCYNRLKIVYDTGKYNGYVISSWPRGTKLFGATGAVSSDYSKMIDVSWVKSAQIEGGSYFSYRSGFYEFPTEGRVTVIYTLQDDCTKIPGKSFADCGRVVEATLNDNIIMIGEWTFYKTSLSSITFSNTFRKIDGTYAFHNCLGLSAITFPASMAEPVIETLPNNFGNVTFKGCSNLHSMTSYGLTANPIANAFEGIASTGTLYYPYGSDYSSWLTALGSGWSGVPLGQVNIPYTADTSQVSFSGEVRTISIDTTGLIQSSITAYTIGFDSGVTAVFENGEVTVTFARNRGDTKRGYIVITATTVQDEMVITSIQFTQDAMHPTPQEQQPLTFKITSAGTIVWKANNSNYTKTIQYRKNSGSTWTSITSSKGGTSISVNAGDVIQFRGDNATYSSSNSYYNSFSGSTAKFEVEGNIMSLIDSTGFTNLTTLASSYTFYNLFYNCTGLTSAKNLVLYATTLANYCYQSMFNGCTSLTTAPELPATTLKSQCYANMFEGCTSLTTAPELPATTLASNCYNGMFSGCTSLTTAPELPVTTLAYYCYAYMFSGCTSLNYIKCLATDISASWCTRNWVNGVASTGTFITPSSTNWSTGASGIPSGWTRVDAT